MLNHLDVDTIPDELVFGLLGYGIWPDKFWTILVLDGRVVECEDAKKLRRREVP